MNKKEFEVITCECGKECPVEFASLDKEGCWICPDCAIEALKGLSTENVVDGKLGEEPAFPMVGEMSGADSFAFTGISKRFYAAKCAMEALISSGFTFKSDAGEIIRRSYVFADELLKQENK